MDGFFSARGNGCDLFFAAVVHFMALLHFTGQVKNRVLRVHQVRDAAGWGFGMTSSSLCLAVVSVIIMAIFRMPPGRYKHRRFWKLPSDLRHSPYFAATSSFPKRTKRVVTGTESPVPRPSVVSGVLAFNARQVIAEV